MYAVAGHEAYHIKHKHQLVTCLGEIYLPLQIGTSSYKMSGKLLQHLLSSSLKEKRWMRSLIRLPMFTIALLGVDAGMRLKTTLNKTLEADADISSSIKLGTAGTLIRFFKTHADNDKHKHDGVHPSISNRIKYLSIVKKMIVSSNTRSIFTRAEKSCVIENSAPTKSENASIRKIQ